MEGIKSLVEASKHVGIMEKMFLKSKIEAAERDVVNIEKMQGFIMKLLDEFYPECADIDGGTFQDLAEEHGILVSEVRHEPCGEFCNCNTMVYDEEWTDGVSCYHAADWLTTNDPRSEDSLPPLPGSQGPHQDL